MRTIGGRDIRPPHGKELFTMDMNFLKNRRFDKTHVVAKRMVAEK